MDTAQSNNVQDVYTTIDSLLDGVTHLTLAYRDAKVDAKIPMSTKMDILSTVIFKLDKTIGIVQQLGVSPDIDEQNVLQCVSVLGRLERLRGAVIAELAWVSGMDPSDDGMKAMTSLH